jgi:hypothetical protein
VTSLSGVYTGRSRNEGLWNDRLWRIVLKKSLLAGERILFGPLMRFAHGEPHRFREKRPRTFVPALLSVAAVETPIKINFREILVSFAFRLLQQYLPTADLR